jgi:hypothetical protein
MKLAALAESLLRDRAERKARKPVRAAQSERDDFDPFEFTRWRIVRDKGEPPFGPGYLPRTSMRPGSVGWFIECRSCGDEFESKGWAFCPTCMEMPADERRACRKALERSETVGATGHASARSAEPAPLPQRVGTEIIEEFPPLFGPSDFPTILIGSGQRGRLLSPDLVASILKLEGEWLMGERQRKKAQAEQEVA